MAADTQQPLDLILARNLMSVLETPSFLVDDGGVIVFFNEAAGTMLGKRFEETGRMPRGQWNEIGPVDASGELIDSAELPLSIALRDVRTDQEGVVEVETSAVPLVSGGDFHGALVLFWPVES